MAHRQLAREAALQSAVLLANVGSVLPLNVSSSIKRIAILGPSANDTAGYDRCWEVSEVPLFLRHCLHCALLYFTFTHLFPFDS